MSNSGIVYFIQHSAREKERKEKEKRDKDWKLEPNNFQVASRQDLLNTPPKPKKIQLIQEEELGERFCCCFF